MFIRIFSLAIALLLSACDTPSEVHLQNNGDGTSTMTLSAPEFLTEGRMLTTDDLALELIINNTSVPVFPEGDLWQVEVVVEPGQVLNFRVAWSQKGPRPVPLASLSETFTVPDDVGSVTLTLPSTSFTTDFDFDTDKRSNIAEIRAGTDPTNGLLPGGEPALLPVNYRIGIPPELQPVADDESSNLILVAVINGATFNTVLQADRKEWWGSTMEYDGNDVFIELKFVLDSNRDDDLFNYKYRLPLGPDGLEASVFL